MRILVTRPEPDATHLKARLAAMGHEAAVAPVLVVHYLPPAKLFGEPVQAVVATSRNALSAVASHPDLGTLVTKPIFVVGPKTGNLAREFGFARVIEGAGTGKDLVAPIVAEASPSAGAVLHLAGETLAYDLRGALEREGFGYTTTIVYRTEPAENLPSETITMIRAGAIDAAIVMSPRTAGLTAMLCKRAQLERDAARIPFLAISAATAAALAPLAPASVAVAARPTLEEVLALVTKLAANSGNKNA